jgi:hypothetical protein
LYATWIDAQQDATPKDKNSVCMSIT